MKVLTPFILSLISSISFAATSDQEVVSTIKTANDGEIKLAELAKDKAQSASVREFAQEMIDEHSENNKKAISLRASLNATDDYDGVKKLQRKADSITADLKKTNGKAFDKAYIKQQVKMHKDLLKDLDNKLIPSAKNPELKTFATETKEHVQAHLTKAEQILRTLD